MRYLSFYDWLTSLTQRLPSLSMLSQIAGFLSFLKLSHIPLYDYTTTCLFIHPMKDIELFQLRAVKTAVVW